MKRKFSLAVLHGVLSLGLAGFSLPARAFSLPSLSPITSPLTSFNPSNPSISTNPGQSNIIPGLNLPNSLSQIFSSPLNQLKSVLSTIDPSTQSKIAALANSVGLDLKSALQAAGVTGALGIDDPQKVAQTIQSGSKPFDDGNFHDGTDELLKATDAASVEQQTEAVLGEVGQQNLSQSTQNVFNLAQQSQQIGTDCASKTITQEVMKCALLQNSLALQASSNLYDISTQNFVAQNTMTRVMNDLRQHNNEQESKEQLQSEQMAQMEEESLSSLAGISQCPSGSDPVLCP